jgi:predicted dehydrogenase
MANKQLIRWGIIGAGNVCEVKSGPGFYKTESSQLLAVMRRNAAKAQDFAQRHNVPLWYDKAEDILNHPEIDAVYIATPPVFHKDYAIAALKAGKHVYIEKPVTLSATECDDIIRAQQQASTKVCVAHYRRYVPCFLKFKELVHSGAIGTPLMVSINLLRPAPTAVTEEYWRVYPAISGGGIFHDLAPHQLDFMLQCFGDIEYATGFGYNQRKFTLADDCLLGSAKFLSGVAFQGRWHFAARVEDKIDICEVLGTTGKLSINFFGDMAIHLQNADGAQEIRIPNPQHMQQPMIEQVNAYLRGERDNPCSLQDAKKVMQLMDIFSSH